MTLLELLVVLVVLGLSAAMVMPFLQPPRAAAPDAPLVRARSVAVRRGESVRLETSRDGAWTVRSAADPTGAVLLAGDDTAAGGSAPARSVLITALGTCLPEGAAPPGQPAWDPVRCAVTPP